MATLEVHNGRGRVERVQIGREDTVLFGASSACTIVLDGTGVAPVHGRIRWQKRRYKVDAGADVDAVEVNGKKIKSSTLYQGDEIRAGTCRIFVISTEDFDATPEDEKTRIQPAPRAIGPTLNALTSGPTGLFDSPSFAEVLDAPARPEPLQRQRPWKRASEPVNAPAAVVPPPQPNLWQRVKALLVRSGDAPGEERVLSSPIILGLVGTFVVLIVASFGLWGLITKMTAERQYAKAFQSLDDGDYRNAARELEAFIASNPSDKRVGKARVFRALANVRQNTTASGAAWDHALEAAHKMVSEVGELDEYRDASIELAEQLVKTVEGLADRARNLADPTLLRAAEDALRLEQRVAGKASDGLLNKSRALARLDQAREAIRRSQARARGLAALDAAIAAGSASQAFSARDELVSIYPDMAADRDVVSRLVKATDLVRQAAKFDPSGRPGETEPHRDALGPPTTLVLRLEPGAKPSGRDVVYGLSDGLAFGLDAATGAPLWQTPVGNSSPFPPLVIAGGDPSVLVIDARYDDLVRLDGRTGKLIWRQELGERVVEPPLLLGSQVFQPTGSGKVLAIDLASGALRGTLNLGRPLARSLVNDESGEHLMILGDEDCLFILGRDPLACVAVEYLGHEPGSIAATPARVGRFLVVPENISLDNGQWRVLLIDESGGSVKPRQTLPVAGWTARTPATAGSVIWSASDRNELIAYSVGLYDAEPPFKPVATIKSDNDASGPAFGLAKSQREFWLASSRSGRFDLNPEGGKLTNVWSLAQAGPSVAPIQVSGRLAIFTQQSADGPGVALWAVDTQSGTVRWRTTLGAAWPVAVVPGNEEGSLRTLGFDGRDLTLGLDLLTRGGFVEQPFHKPGSFRVPTIGSRWLACGEWTVLVPQAAADHVLVRRGAEAFHAVDLPSPLGAQPIAWEGSLLVPGADGRVYLIDPATGDSTADPFVPRFDKGHSSRWRSPVLVEGGAVVLADEDGRVRRITRAENPRRRLVVAGETSLGKAVLTDPASTGASVLITTVDGKVRALAARDLSPIASVDLPAPRSFGPVAVGGHGFVADALGDVFVFAGDGRKLWQARLTSTLNESPALRNDAAWFLARNGALESRGLNDGASGERLTLGVLPAGPPIATGNLLVVPTGLGSFRALVDDRTAGTPSKAGD